MDKLAYAFLKEKLSMYPLRRKDNTSKVIYERRSYTIVYLYIA